MSGQQYLNSLTENATRLGMRLQESISEHTRDFNRYSNFEISDDKAKNIRSQLDSSSDREKLDAMKRLIAVRGLTLHCISHPSSSFLKVETCLNTLLK